MPEKFRPDHPDMALIIALGWREYLREKYYFAGEHIGWLEYPPKCPRAEKS